MPISLSIRLGLGSNSSVSVLGSASAGSLLSISPVYLTGSSPISFSVQWFRDGAPISGATSATYMTGMGDVGTDITAAITPAGGSPILSVNAVTIILSSVAPAAIDPAAWSVEVIQGDPANIGLRYLGPDPFEGAAPITGIKRQRTVGATVYPDYFVPRPNALPVKGQRYSVPADPGVVNAYQLFAINGQGTPNKGTAKQITPWIATGAPVAYALIDWDLQPEPGDAGGANLTIFRHPSNPDALVDATTWIDVDSGSGFGAPVQLSGLQIGVPTRISLPVGMSQVRIWDDNGQTPVNKGPAKSVTPWVNTNVAPVYLTPPTITPASGPVGTVFTLEHGTASGYPAPTMTLALSLGATDVTGSIVNTGGVLTYTSAAAGALTLIGTATNGSGSDPSDPATATVTSASASTLDLVDGYYLQAPNPIVYTADPVNGLQVQTQTGLQLRHVDQGATAADPATLVRNGAQWRPQAGQVGWQGRPVLGFDGRMVDGGSVIVYSDTVNVSPERTNAPFTIPGAGALVMAVSNPAAIPTGYQGQRTNGAVMEYMVVHFASAAPVAGRFRSGARGTVAPRSNWTAAQVAARLDTAFPRGLSGFTSSTGMKTSDIAPLIASLKTPSSSWTMGFEMATYSPQLGISGYGRDRSFTLGKAMLMLRASSTTYITDAQRLEIALALVRQGIDWYCAVIDGAWWQENGAATQGALWGVLAAGLLLDDQYMMNMVLAPETAESAPGLVLGYRPFTEQRNYLYVEAAARTSGNPENVNWGIYVGSGGSETGDKNFPDTIKIDSGMLGIPEWAISPGRFSASGNSAHLAAKYRSENAEGITPAIAALHDAFNGTHAGYNLTPLQVIARYRDRMAWVRDAYDTAVAGGMSNIDTMRFRPQPTNTWGGVIPNTEKAIYNACVPNNSRWYGKPERPFSPYVSATGNTVTVTFHPWIGAHGRTVTGRKIYWSDDDGATWNTISGIAGNATSHTFTATASSTILVQTSIITDQGESPRSVNQDNYLAANNGAGLGLQGVIATGAASTTTYTATINTLAAPLIFFDTGKARGANAADIPLSGTSTAPDGSVIEVQLVDATTLVVVHAWQNIATVSGGSWSGEYLTAFRVQPYLKAEARVAGSSATPARTDRKIKLGHIAMLVGQSEDHHMAQGVYDNALQTTPTLVNAAAEDSVFLMQWSEGATQTFAANGIVAINPANRGAVPGVTRSMVHMADVLTRNAPGENFLFIAAVQSGTSYVGLVDGQNDGPAPAGDERSWSQTFGDALTYIRQWGADVGVLMSTWTAAPSTVPGGYRVGHYPIFSGLYADTAQGVALPTYGALTNSTYSGAVYRLDHGFWDLSGLNRPQAVLDPAVTKMFFYGPHRFEDASHGIGKFATATSGVASAVLNVRDTSSNGMGLGSTTPVRFWTQGAGLASTETVVIEGSADGSTGWTTVATQAGSTSAHFMVVPATIYQYYRATITKTGGGSVTANVYATGVSGTNSNKQTCRDLIRAMVADSVLSPIMLPKGPEILTYQNGYGTPDTTSTTYEPTPANWVSWRDYAHPTEYSDDGLPARARHTAVAMLYAFGVGPAPAVRRDVPKFNRTYWDPAGAFVQLWYEDALGACPRISTTRIERSESAIPATYPHRTVVAGFYRNNAPCTNVVIAPGVTTPGNSNVVQINAEGDPFDYTDVIGFGLGGASGVVQWPQDEYDGIWKNLPIAITGFAGVTGIAMEPMPSSAALANPLPAPQTFTMSNATLSPRFIDPAQIGATSELTLRWKGKFGSTLLGEVLFSISGNQLTVKRRNSGTSLLRRIEVVSQDTSNASIVPTTNTGIIVADDQTVDLVVSLSLVSGNRVAKLFLDGTQVWSIALTGTATTTWSTNRNLGVFSAATTGTPDGVTEVVEIWKAYTSDGNYGALGTPYKRIAAGSGGTIVETPATPVWRQP